MGKEGERWEKWGKIGEKWRKVGRKKRKLTAKIVEANDETGKGEVNRIG